MCNIHWLDSGSRISRFEALAHNNELLQRIAQVTRDVCGERNKEQADNVTVNGNFQNMLHFLGTHDTSLKSEGYFTLILDHCEWEWYASMDITMIYTVRAFSLKEQEGQCWQIIIHRLRNLTTPSDNIA